MKQQAVSRIFSVRGMVCDNCRNKLEKGLSKLAGVREVEASLLKSQVTVKFNPAVVEPEQLRIAIQNLGYQMGASAPTGFSGWGWLGLGILILALYLLIKYTIGFNLIPQVNQSMGYGLLFGVGLLVSIHCLAMCGGINLSQTIAAAETKPPDRWGSLKPGLWYNFGRLISYTLVGGLVGALGSLLSLSGAAKGLVAIIAGVIMMVIGLQMLNLFPGLPQWRISLPRCWRGKIEGQQAKRRPLLVGLLNGLMPCGPLQTMQLYALGTGSFLAGAAAMFFFGLGTVPLVLGLGIASTWLSRRFTQRMLKFSAVLILILGLTMALRGVTLSGFKLAVNNPTNSNIAKIEAGYQNVTSLVKANSYQPIVVQQGIPVRWTLLATSAELNGCNNPLVVPQYRIQKYLQPGKNLIEFTPTEIGIIPFSCWMGMIRSNIKVVPQLPQTAVN